MLVLAVRRKVQERQLLVAALELQDFAAQVQTALRTRGDKNSRFQLKIRAELGSKWGLVLVIGHKPGSRPSSIDSHVYATMLAV